MKAHSLESTLEKVSRVITDRYGLRLVCEGDRCTTDESHTAPFLA